MPAPMTGTRSATNGTHAGSAQAPKTIRTTVILPFVLDRNLEVYCLRNGHMKTEILTAALSEFLRKRGVRPDKLPKVSW